MADQAALKRLAQVIAARDQWRLAQRAKGITFTDLLNRAISGQLEKDFDFPELDLSGADLSGAQLPSVQLLDANLTRANLTGAELTTADLTGANLSHARLSGARLERANLSMASFVAADLTGANLSQANLGVADLTGADLTRATLHGANLSHAHLRGARLPGAGLIGADFIEADLTGADLSGADLSQARFIRTNLTDATLDGCYVYGVTVWDVKLDGASQRGLVITNGGRYSVKGPDPQITVDELEVAQFVYLLLRNEKVRHVVDTLTAKAVLILGRFTEERKRVLDAVRDALRARDLLPIIFDFEGPRSQDLTETVRTLAHLSRFIIADLTDPRSIPQELMAIVPILPSVPVQPVIHKSQKPWAMFGSLRRYPWVLEPYRYASGPALIAALDEHVIAPAEQAVERLRHGTGEG